MSLDPSETRTEIRVGHCLALLREMPPESVHMVFPRQTDGRFVPGVHAWRPPKPHWNKGWLEHEYLTLGRSAGDIARAVGVTDEAIRFWLAKHSIPRRTVSEARALKHWGADGEKNPMFGRVGPLNPNYVDGETPERQALYHTGAWRRIVREVFARDGNCCRRCGSGGHKDAPLNAHHVRPWAGNPGLRRKRSNIITLCRPCHRWVHSRANADREFLA